MHAEQAAEVHGPHLDDERVGEAEGVVRQEVRRDGYGNVFEAMVACECVCGDRVVLRVEEEEPVERLAGGSVQVRDNAIPDEGLQGGLCRCE